MVFTVFARFSARFHGFRKREAREKETPAISKKLGVAQDSAVSDSKTSRFRALLVKFNHI